MDDAGNWSTVPAKINFKVDAKFAETPFFYLFAMFIISLIIFLFAYFRLKIAKRYQIKLERIVEERTSNIKQAKEMAEIAAYEEKNLRAKAEEESRQKVELLRIISHDLKNPVFAIKGFAEMLVKNSNLNAEDKELVKMIQNSENRLQELITQLFSFSMFEGETPSVVKNKLNVKDEITKIIERFIPHAVKKEQSLIKEFYINNTLILADNLMFSQIMENLIGNAIKYSPLGKDIIIGLKEDQEKVAISVKDFGPGFTEEDKLNLYKPFVKLSSIPTAGELSSGLGLAIVKKFVELNDGTISLVSTKGTGAEFIIEFEKLA